MCQTPTSLCWFGWGGTSEKRLSETQPVMTKKTNFGSTQNILSMSYSTNGTYISHRTCDITEWNYPSLIDNGSTLDLFSLRPESRHLSSDGDKLQLLCQIDTLVDLQMDTHSGSSCQVHQIIRNFSTCIMYMYIRVSKPLNNMCSIFSFSPHPSLSLSLSLFSLSHTHTHTCTYTPVSDTCNDYWHCDLLEHNSKVDNTTRTFQSTDLYQLETTWWWYQPYYYTMLR